MGWFEYVDSVGIAGAFGFAAYQTRRAAVEERRRDEDRRTERSLELYRDLVVEGDTAAAFHRLSVMLRRKGSEQSTGTTWHLLTDDDFASGGLLDPREDGTDTPFEDLYRVLWFFERVENSRHHGLVENDVLMRTIGFHCWWWSELLRGVRSPKASHSLRTLGPLAREWAMKCEEYENWVNRCATDFGGGGPAMGVSLT